MSSSHGADDSTDDKKDLTRLEDLSEFLHESDPKTEAILAKNNSKESPKKGTPSASLDDLDDLDPSTENSKEHEITLEEAVDAIEADSAKEVDASVAENLVEESGQEITSELVSESPEVPSPGTDEISLDAHDTTDFQLPTDDAPVEENTANEDSSADEELVINEEITVDEDTAIVEQLDESLSDDITDIQEDIEEEIQIEEINASDSPSDSSSSPEPTHEIAPKENFQDVRDFGESMTFGQVGQGGNPPYSVILRNIQYKEDAEEIKRVLKEHGLLTENTQKEIEQGLVNGSILLSQLAEYPAIFLAHAFRRFDLTLEMGLSAELHQSKSYKDENYRGLVSKHSLYQNIDSHVDLMSGPVTLDQIILSTLSTLENYKIHRYLDVASESVLVDELTFNDSHKNIQKKRTGSKKKPIDIFDLDFASPSLAEIYKDLAQKLRLQAKELKGNAVVGINYQITPLTATLASARGGDEGLTNAYRITCTGNIVWLSHLQAPL